MSIALSQLEFFSAHPKRPLTTQLQPPHPGGDCPLPARVLLGRRRLPRGGCRRRRQSERRSGRRRARDCASLGPDAWRDEDDGCAGPRAAQGVSLAPKPIASVPSPCPFTLPPCTLPLRPSHAPLHPAPTLSTLSPYPLHPPPPQSRSSPVPPLSRSSQPDSAARGETLHPSPSPCSFTLLLHPTPFLHPTSPPGLIPFRQSRSSQPDSTAEGRPSTHSVPPSRRDPSSAGEAAG